ncbi:ALF repeat-containing protein, partial [Streptomyces sp. NPDC044948]|uniref:ALF repeat-containing protein n=1 Tax=Streptomyces sp. NPDC044948 TaxID=3157092 RepID=UPI0034079352
PICQRGGRRSRRLRRADRGGPGRGGASGAAQSEAAEAKRQAAIATAAANRATNSASTAQALANTAASAARQARDAANSAAAHASKAADAAEEAVKNAGKAIDYANKSTAHAAEAVKAADTATKAVTDAMTVEQNARDAELARIEQEKLQGIDEARQLAQIEAAERADYEDKRTQDAQTEQALKEVIAAAEKALWETGDLTLAATLGRKAATGLLDSKGPWTRQAAQFALAGSDEDVLSWVDLDRTLAMNQDDRETVLYLAQISSPTIAEAAYAALQDSSSTAVGDFLTSGVIRASQDDNKVQIGRILDDDPGKAVIKAANDALDENTPEGYQDFFDRTYPAAVREDDSVATATLTATGGEYVKAYAEVALEGPTWMRRSLVQTAQYKAARLDHDSATHVAAIRGSIAAAAKIAYQAQKDAADASKAAADARKAGEEAQEWADKALDAADKASGYSQQAEDNADAADRSSAAAQASANQASAAAATARQASRSANYSANKAIDAARSALQSSYSAQASAAAARQSELQAGRDKAAAAAAASQAHQIADQKRRIEIQEKAREAAEKAREQRQQGRNPADSGTNDEVRPNGTDTGTGGEGEDWWSDAGWWADTANKVSVASGLIAAGLGAASLVFPPLAAGAAFFGYVSLGAGALSALFTGIEHGFLSGEFVSSVGSAALNLATFGRGKAVKSLVKKASPVVSKIAHEGKELVSDFVDDLVPF